MSENPLSHDQITAAVEQHVRTLRLLGVEAVPVGAGEPLALDAVAPGEPEAPAAASETKEPRQEPAMTDDALFDAPAEASPYAGLSVAEKQRALEELREEHDRECPHCTQATAHTQTVFGEGSADAGLMFVGEAPGAEEDRQGRPFVGRSGQKLTEMIEAMGFARAEVYIANVLKARPPDNATPTLAEAAKCGPYLRRQIEIIQPRVIVTLGGPAAKLLL
ncbi:MAG: uracil-DNA glycosylase, partial [Phycisphaerales bacterium JB038]